jgi:CubicO group peptidase (beta-lactamase class C family)
MPNSGAEPGAEPDLEAVLACVEPVYRAFAETTRLPGLVFGVASASAGALARGWGWARLDRGEPASPDTVFRIASMTKHVAALAILKLRDEGALALDQPVRDHVPELSDPPSADSAGVTVRDLLNHTAGLVTDDAWADRNLGLTPEAFSRLIGDAGLWARPPGLSFEYSNTGYAILGRVIRSAAGRPFQAYIRSALLEPLGMTQTGFDPAAVPPSRLALGYRLEGEGWRAERMEPDGELGVMGGLLTTARDYGRFLSFLLDAWPARDDPDPAPLRRASRRELGLRGGPPWPPTIRGTKDGRAIFASTTYGLGLAASADEVLGSYLQHRGGLPGYGSDVLFSPDVGVGLFGFANLTYAPVHEANWTAAATLQAAGLWRPRLLPASPELQAAMAAVVDGIRAGGLHLAKASLADNLLLDTPAEVFAAQLADVQAIVGLSPRAVLEPRHRLAGRFTLYGETGQVSGELSLRPGAPHSIQTLRFDESC